MSESRELGALMVRNGDAPVGLGTAAPGVKVLDDGGEFLEYRNGWYLYVPPGAIYVEIENPGGKKVEIPHARLCEILPALITYARHRSFIAPKATTDDLAGLARIVDGGGL